MNNQHYFIFREPENFDGLLAGLLLRYKVFHESRLENFIDENEAHIDLDCYDLYSRHFILYEHYGISSRAVGYVRMVTDQPGKFRQELFLLSKCDPRLFKNVYRIPDNPFPCMNYSPYRKEINNAYESAKKKNEKFIEVSRLSLDPSVRGLCIVQNLIACIFSAFEAVGGGEAVISCDSEHETFYKRFGAMKLPLTKNYYCQQVQSFGIIMSLSPKRLPEAIKSKITRMVIFYEKSNCICFSPDKSELLDSYIAAKAQACCLSQVAMM